MTDMNPNPDELFASRTVDGVVMWVGARLDPRNGLWAPLLAVDGPFVDECVLDPVWDERDDAMVEAIRRANEVLHEMRRYR